MRNACFIIPYFGKFPESFNIFLKTCETNIDFDWLIITDDTTPRLWPDNVHVKNMSFSDFVARIQANFDFPITLHRAYKICDYRGAFGEIFAEELKNYEFWGHCDTDQYFGNISEFITDEILEMYDKILCLGHFTLFRNVTEINQLYKKKDIKYNQDYRDVFTSMDHWIFDEWPVAERTSLNRICKQENVYTYYNHNCFCDLLPFKSCFKRTLFDLNTETWTPDNVRNEIYIWQKGKLLRCWVENNSLKKQSILYVHIRQRKINCKKYCQSKNAFAIYPNVFLSADDFSDKEIIDMLKKSKRMGSFYPDETARKIHHITGFFVLVFKRLKRMLKLG